jgi:hypothetical protein
MVRQALPVDVQADAVLRSASGARTVGAVARGVVTVAAIGVTTAIVVGMSLLWTADLRDDYLVLGALGASARWRRATGALLSSTLMALGAVIGTVWGVLGVGAFQWAVGRSARFAPDWIALLVVTTILVAAIGGAAAVPRAVVARRRS